MEILEKQKDVEKEIAKKIKIPKDVKEKIYTKLFKNFLIAIVILVYFIFLNLGYSRLDKNVFKSDLNIFAGILIISTIAIFEIAYRKDNGEIALHGVELLVLSILTLFLPYVYLYRGIVFKFIYSFSAIYIAIYYVIKAIIIYGIEIRKYKASLSDVKELINKEKVETYLDEKNERKFKDLDEDELQKLKEKEKNTKKKSNVKSKTINKKEAEDKKKTKAKESSTTTKTTRTRKSNKLDENEKKAKRTQETTETKTKAKTTTRASKKKIEVDSESTNKTKKTKTKSEKSKITENNQPVKRKRGRPPKVVEKKEKVK